MWSHTDIIESDIILREHYAWTDNWEKESIEWVNINAATALITPVLVFLWTLTAWIAVDYYCEVNWWSWNLPENWNEDNSVNLACAISWATFALWVVWLWKTVLKYGTKEWIELLAKEGWKKADEFIQVWKKVITLDFPVQTRYTVLDKIPSRIQNTDLRNAMQATLNAGKTIDEKTYYKLADNSDLLFDAPIIKNTLGLTKIRYSVDELADLVKIMDESELDTQLIYVLKKDDTLVFSLRVDNPTTALPHPVLSKWENVQMAGTIRKWSDWILIIDNSSWHFIPDKHKSWFTENIWKVSSKINETEKFSAKVDEFEKLQPIKK